MIQYQCAGCNMPNSVADIHDGARVRCPACSTIQTIGHKVAGFDRPDQSNPGHDPWAVGLARDHRFSGEHSDSDGSRSQSPVKIGFGETTGIESGRIEFEAPVNHTHQTDWSEPLDRERSPGNHMISIRNVPGRYVPYSEVRQSERNVSRIPDTTNWFS